MAVCAHLVFLTAGSLVARRSLASGFPPPPPPWWLVAIHSAHAIATPGSLLVFVLFWALVYPGYPEASSQPINYFVHGANFLAMFLEVAFLSSLPYFFFYIWSSWLAYAIIYVLFTITYFRAGGRNESHNAYIYAALDWSTRGGAASGGVLAGIIVFVIVPLLGWAAWALVPCRDRAGRRPRRRRPRSLSRSLPRRRQRCDLDNSLFSRLGYCGLWATSTAARALTRGWWSSPPPVAAAVGAGAAAAAAAVSRMPSPPSSPLPACAPSPPCRAA